MRPLHRNLDRLQLELVGQEQDLGIESPALNMLSRKDDVGRLAGKRLEAALRVAIAESEHDSQAQVEESAIELAQEWLPLGLQFALQPTRSDGDIGAVANGGEQLVGLIDRRGQIGVGEQHHVAAGVQHAVAHAVAFAAIAGIFQQPDTVIDGGKLAHHLGGVVLRAVVDYDDLGRKPPLTHVVEHLGERAGEPLAFVISGKNKAVAGFHRQQLRRSRLYDSCNNAARN